MNLNTCSIIITVLATLNNNILAFEIDAPDTWCLNRKEQSKIPNTAITLNSYCQLLMSSASLETQNPSNEKSHLNSIKEDTTSTEMASRQILNVEFEVYGKVQGVFFRKNTVEQGKKLKLKGWCMNTSDGTVKGVMEGEPDKIKEMKHWLSHIGSKMSRIDRAEFRNERVVSAPSFKEFSVRY